MREELEIAASEPAEPSGNGECLTQSERLLAVLTPRQREVASLASEGKQYGEIAEALGVGIPTARTHLHRVYRTLGVVNKLQLAKLLGREAGWLEGRDFSGLSRREWQMLHLSSEGMQAKQIALPLHLSVSTVRSHQSNLMRNLGVSNVVELGHVASAFKAKSMGAAQTVQPAVVDALNRIKQTREYKLIEGEVGLQGLVTACLSNQSQTRDILRDTQTAAVVQEVIDREIGVYRPTLND